MNTDQAKALVVGVIGDVAPEVDASGLDPDVSLRDAVDLDSMDFLTVVSELSERAGIDIPEDDFVRLDSVAGAVAYLVARTS